MPMPKSEYDDSIRPAADDPEAKSRLVKILTIAGGILTIAGVVIAALLWLFSLNATADYAKRKVDEHDKALQDKADKNEVRDGFHEINRKLDQINDYLLGNPKPHKR